VQAPAQINTLTSLRFFAAMWVVLYHYWPNLGVSPPAVVEKGYLGVELFFTLSGFILSHVYLDSFERGGFRYGAFLWARLARIYPLHLATLAGVGAMAAGAAAIGHDVDANVLSWAALPANLLLVQAWGLAPVAGWNHPSWSISAEWFAYLSFPAFAWAALKLQRRPMLALAGALALPVLVYAAFQQLTGESLTQATIAWGVLRIVPCFALGCALFLVWRTDRLRGFGAAAAGAFFSGAATLGLAAAGAPDAVIVCAAAGLIYCLAALAKAGRNTGGGRILVYLGEISYSIYMICIPWKLLFVNLAAQAFHLDKGNLPLWLWLLFFASVVPLAAASHALVEKPARAALKRGLRLSIGTIASVA
jgi:peptidoglycan/LPS O-acetylase OafA/YrhL